MKLTREQAIAERRKMWRWIAEEIENRRRCVDLRICKGRYLAEKKYGEIRPINDCFLCEYDFQDQFDKSKPCQKCPVKVKKEGEGCLGGLYYKVKRADTWQEQAALARQIAELPEREDV